MVSGSLGSPDIWVLLILDRRLERIPIQTDSIEPINAILEDCSGSSNSAIVRRIHHTLKR
ncbi:hypothetical protein Goshw_018474, partial [Gossypium schwendimanii]|nr:hypothetical protein [Gossypium schwendimanii]